ncbi:MAG: hypothetical protein ACRD12_22990 [Acidimicrobiales bacterium]
MRIDRPVLAVILCALVIAGVGAACSSAAKNASADVAVSRCEADPSGGQPSAAGEITNHSSKDSGYAFRVTFVDTAGNKVSEGAGGVARVPAGGTATWTVGGLAGGKGPFTCNISSVVRTAVP